jgi:hypothetical protein
VPLLPPRIGVERADSAVVRRVRADEEAAERERQREENVMREPHSGIAIARRWRELQQQASTPVGQTSEREAAGAVSPFPLPVTIPNAFRPKRKIGQIYVNIPGRAGFTCRRMVSIPTPGPAADRGEQSVLGRVRAVQAAWV